MNYFGALQTATSYREAFAHLARPFLRRTICSIVYTHKATATTLVTGVRRTSYLSEPILTPSTI